MLADFKSARTCETASLFSLFGRICNPTVSSIGICNPAITNNHCIAFQMLILNAGGFQIRQNV